MKLIPLTQGKFAKVDDEDYEYLNQWKWHAFKTKYAFYATRSVVLMGKKKTIRMHRVVLNLGYLDKKIVDHKDHDGLNNQKANLRLCTNAENTRNRISRCGTSKYLGVYLKKGEDYKQKTYPDKWCVRIRSNKKDIFIGYFENEIEAAGAYNKAALMYHGEFANLNILPLIKTL